MASEMNEREKKIAEKPGFRFEKPSLSNSINNVFDKPGFSKTLLIEFEKLGFSI